MNNPVQAGAGQWHELARLGEKVYTNQPAEILGEELRRLLSLGEEASWPFAIMCRALALSEADALCVALCVYAESEAADPLTERELRGHCRRVNGGISGTPSAALFQAGGGLVYLRSFVWRFLEGLPPRLPEGARLELPARESENLHDPGLLNDMKRFAERVISAQQRIPAVVLLEGEQGSGRSYLFGRLAWELGCTLLHLPFGVAEPLLWEELLTISALYGALICINLSPGTPVETLAGQAGLLLIRAECGAGARNIGECLLLRRQVGAIERERIQCYLSGLLPELLGNEPIPAGGMERLGQQRVGAVMDFVRQARAQVWAAGRPLCWEQLRELQRRCAPPAGAGVSLLDSGYLLDDLVTARRQQIQLKRICSFVRAKETVYGGWGFGGKATWGQGMAVLFYGPPGTGKTMAATAIANELGLPLMRVDLSQLISKYIGETQKNIGRIFDEATRDGGILFFDEADALFSRRSEVGDSQDKYANAEIAYLLQRTEGHGGLCILATNLLQNFDEAFRRRITYMIHFPLPDAAQRRRIWEGIFPPAVPVDSLDLDLLARELELSGASIKSCALHAAYLAAASGSPVTMGMVLDGAQEEYTKQGKTLGSHMTRLLCNQEVQV